MRATPTKIRGTEAVGHSFLAFERLFREGLNQYLLCGAVCSVEDIWRMSPGNHRDLLKKKGYSQKAIRKLLNNLFEDSKMLRRLHHDGFFSLPHCWHASLCSLMDSAASRLSKNFGSYRRNNWQNLYAAALVGLLREIDNAAIDCGFQTGNRDLTKEQREQAVILINELLPELRDQGIVLRNSLQPLPAFSLASELMRQGIPRDLLAQMRNSFPDATGRIPDFPNPEALRKRCERIWKSEDLKQEAEQLIKDWKETYRPPAPLAFASQTSQTSIPAEPSRDTPTLEHRQG